MTVSAKEILAEAEALRETIISDRRALHAAPEAGADLPRTREYVAGRLREMGYEPKELAGGITAEITGSDTGNCVLLRADMDALCVTEQTDLPFRSQNGCMHACGHDMHTAMLLGAAKLLRGHQSKLNGTVKLVFQPDEEGFTGAKAMLAAGVLREPAPQAGFALHVHSGTPSGLVLCGEGTFMAGCTLFRVTVHGTGCQKPVSTQSTSPRTSILHSKSLSRARLQRNSLRSSQSADSPAVMRRISSRHLRSLKARSARLTAS